ncbi:MAG: NAD(P)H-dependent oxidoreductase [Bdellovibrionales bacterium]|nr:NAD(P)H-dependent oxidoreductase [Bdellovibrionales bacterium]
MIVILSGTNRLNSRTLIVAKKVKEFYDELNEKSELMDLSLIPIAYGKEQSYSDPVGAELRQAIEKINSAKGLVIISPEYNGSYPGVLKYFIDHWSYPKSFEYRPVCFIGLGGRFGGLRPVEHLQQVFGYRNAFMFPQRVFLFNVWDLIKENTLQDEFSLELLKGQSRGFIHFITALGQQDLKPR